LPEALVEKYVYARFEHLNDETRLTDKQLKDQLEGIRNNGEELLKRIASLRSSYADEFDGCRSTSLDGLGIRLRSQALW
jgi:hemerythrin superfamily protein